MIPADEGVGKKKVFFSEEKNQKTFDCLVSSRAAD
jgi:hypothetical protein